jgi:predicted ATPase with chaperone activity
MLDRIDIHIEVSRVAYEKLSGDRLGESSESIRERVQAARDIQNKRFQAMVRQTLFVMQTCASGRSGSFAGCRTRVRV